MDKCTCGDRNALLAMSRRCPMCGGGFVAIDQPIASIVKAVAGEAQHLERYWSLPDLQTALDACYGDLGELREQPDSPDRAVIESLIEDRIGQLGTEMRRRIRGGQDLAAARRDASRRPQEFVRRVKGAFDLREVVARETGVPIPANGLIRSPLRDDDHTPSFRVYPDRYRDFGTGESGDVITWRMRFHRVTFGQALESLAIEASIPLPQDRPSAQGRLRGLRVREVRRG